MNFDPLNSVDSLLDDSYVKAVELLASVEHPSEGTLHAACSGELG